MPSLPRSFAARLALGYGLLVAVSIMLVAAIFYVGTIGLLERAVDRKIGALSERLAALGGSAGLRALSGEIERQLSDRADSDTEILAVVDAGGARLAGNLAGWPGSGAPLGRLLQHDVVRYGVTVPARLMVRALPGGARLLVGRDLVEDDAVRALVWRALAMGGACALLLVVGGALVFRRLLERRIGAIRRTALAVEGGDLKRRIAFDSEDEFGLLGRDINRMLDRIEQLIEGVRHVSNAIAHDLRTPLSRIRNKLDDALRQRMTLPGLADGAQTAIEDIDALIQLFEKLLQIAAAESGMRPDTFAPLELDRIAADIVELYDATAEQCQVLLTARAGPAVPAFGERNLLGSALASLIDNAIKYAGTGAAVEVWAAAGADGAVISVRDNGPGIPAADLSRVTQRFYRLDQSRHLPGNGLGLAIVAAIAALHGGRLELADAGPGLLARIVLPAAPKITNL